MLLFVNFCQKGGVQVHPPAYGPGLQLLSLCHNCACALRGTEETLTTCIHYEVDTPASDLRPRIYKKKVRGKLREDIGNQDTRLFHR